MPRYKWRINWPGQTVELMLLEKLAHAALTPCWNGCSETDMIFLGGLIWEADMVLFAMALSFYSVQHQFSWWRCEPSSAPSRIRRRSFLLQPWSLINTASLINTFITFCHTRCKPALVSLHAPMSRTALSTASCFSKTASVRIHGLKKWFRLEGHLPFMAFPQRHGTQITRVRGFTRDTESPFGYICKSSRLHTVIMLLLTIFVVRVDLFSSSRVYLSSFVRRLSQVRVASLFLPLFPSLICIVSLPVSPHRLIANSLCLSFVSGQICSAARFLSAARPFWNTEREMIQTWWVQNGCWGFSWRFRSLSIVDAALPLTALRESAAGSVLYLIRFNGAFVHFHASYTCTWLKLPIS